MGLLQVSQMLAAREVLYHAAARGARAKTVGFNHWMVVKCARVAAIPNCGRMTEPPFENVDENLRALVSSSRPGELWDRALRAEPSSLQYEIERARIPEYLGSENWGHGNAILDYSRWNHLGIWDHAVSAGLTNVRDMVHISVYQSYSNWVPLHQTFYAADRVGLQGDCYLENHYELYIDDRGW